MPKVEVGQFWKSTETRRPQRVFVVRAIYGHFRAVVEYLHPPIQIRRVKLSRFKKHYARCDSRGFTLTAQEIVDAPPPQATIPNDAAPGVRADHADGLAG